jgi:hypothetical protein
MIDLANFVVFKPVTGGYVYARPTPWLFGVRNAYLVTEEQKSALLGLYSASTRPVLWTLGLSLIALTIILGTALSLWANRSGYEVIGLLGLILMIAAIGSLYPAFLAGRHVLLRQLHPILITLPPTKERITAREERQALQAANARSLATMSPTRLRIVRIASLVTLAATVGGMISRAVDVYGADGLSFVTLYRANANLNGAIAMAVIVLMGSFLVVFGRDSRRA